MHVGQFHAPFFHPWCNFCRKTKLVESIAILLKASSRDIIRIPSFACPYKQRNGGRLKIGQRDGKSQTSVF